MSSPFSYDLPENLDKISDQECKKSISGFQVLKNHNLFQSFSSLSIRASFCIFYVIYNFIKRSEQLFFMFQLLFMFHLILW